MKNLFTLASVFLLLYTNLQNTLLIKGSGKSCTTVTYFSYSINLRVALHINRRNDEKSTYFTH